MSKRKSEWRIEREKKDRQRQFLLKKIGLTEKERNEILYQPESERDRDIKDKMFSENNYENAFEECYPYLSLQFDKYPFWFRNIMKFVCLRILNDGFIDGRDLEERFLLETQEANKVLYQLITWKILNKDECFSDDLALDYGIYGVLRKYTGNYKKLAEYLIAIIEFERGKKNG
jgi:hypothetical protein